MKTGMLILWTDPLLHAKIRGVWAINAASGATIKTDKKLVFGPFHPLNINRSVACIVFTNYNGQTDGHTWLDRLS